jgi:hypothetical protein
MGDHAVHHATLADRVETLEAQIKALRAELEATKADFATFRAAICMAAWALAMPNTPGPNITGFCELQDGRRHCHEMLTPDARDALAALIALGKSGYAPTQERVRYTPSDSAPTRAGWQHTSEELPERWNHGPDCNEDTFGCFAEGWRQRGEAHVGG